MRYLFLLILVMVLPCRADDAADTTKVPVTFSGGHETEGRDRGRPVILVAGALKVPPQVFREAFTHVHPAGTNSGGPTPDEARANKAALMHALEPLGVTDERLNQVSNHYRYRRDHGEMWPTVEATAYATVHKGVVTGFVITAAGSGYSSPPDIALQGMPDAHYTAVLAFDPDFDKNGSIKEIVPVAPPPGTTPAPAK